MNRLRDYFLNNKARPINRWLHYLPLYERHFEKFVGQKVTVLEIGVDGGGSLQMWKDFFGPKAHIIGLDGEPTCKFSESQIEVVIGHQGDEELLVKIATSYGGLDIVIDDGGHKYGDQRTSFETLYPFVRHFYAIEDLHTSYWPRYQDPRKNVIRYLTQKLDELSAWHHPAPVTGFTRTTVGMHFYDSLCILEKGQVNEPRAMVTGAQKWE